MSDINYEYINKFEFKKIFSLITPEKLKDSHDFTKISRNVKILSAYNYLSENYYEEYLDDPTESDISVSDSIKETYILGELFYYSDSLPNYIVINVNTDGTVEAYAKTKDFNLLNKFIDNVQYYDLGNNYYNCVIPDGYRVANSKFIYEVSKATYIEIYDNVDATEYRIKGYGHVVLLNSIKVIVKKANMLYSVKPIQLDPYLLISALSVAKITKASKLAREKALKLLSTNKVTIFTSDE